jgi:toxin ParE1/3/4
MPERRFRVIVSDPAGDDLQAIFEYINVRSPLNSKRVRSSLRAKARTLSKSPERGRIVPELADFGIRHLRELIEDPYRIIYEIEGATVEIHAIVDGRRDVTQLLLERLLSGELPVR